MNHSSYIFFLYPPPGKIFSVWGGLKTETGNFLLHFQNSKSSNRCRSVYGADIKRSKINTKSMELHERLTPLNGLRKQVAAQNSNRK